MTHLRLAAGLLALSALVGCELFDEKPTRLTVDWAGTDKRPGCVYDPERALVEARLNLTGWAKGPTTVAVTVTAHADENTSQPVGSHTGTIRVEGQVDRAITVTIPVDRAPHVDIDGGAACSRTVTY